VSQTLDNFSSLIEDDRFKSLDPVGKAEFRDKAFSALISLDPEKLGIYQKLNPEKQDALREDFNSRFNEKYGSSFKVETGEAPKTSRGITIKPGAPLSITSETFTDTKKPTRPIMDPMTERFISGVQAGKIDPSGFDEAAILKLSPIVRDYVPGKYTDWSSRAQKILTDKAVLPEGDYAPLVATSALGAGGALGPIMRAGEFVENNLLTDKQKEQAQLMKQKRQASMGAGMPEKMPNPLAGLSPENQDLLQIAYPELGFSRAAGAGLAATGLGLAGASALESAGISLFSKTGIAAGAALDAAVGASYAKEAPGIIASLAGKPDSYVLNGIEAAIFSSVLGIAARSYTKSKILGAARDSLKFEGTDEQLINYLKDLHAKTPRPVDGTARTVTPKVAAEETVSTPKLIEAPAEAPKAPEAAEVPVATAPTEIVEVPATTEVAVAPKPADEIVPAPASAQAASISPVTDLAKVSEPPAIAPAPSPAEEILPPADVNAPETKPMAEVPAEAPKVDEEKPAVQEKVETFSKKQISTQRKLIGNLTKRADALAQSNPDQANAVYDQIAEEKKNLSDMLSKQKTGKKLKIGDLPDGNSDILNVIDESGGVSPAGKTSQGEYDGFKEVFGKGTARLLVRKGAQPIDQLVQELNGMGYKFETVDDLYRAIDKAVEYRKKSALSQKSQKVQQKQDDEFSKDAIEAKGRNADEIESPVQVDSLKVSEGFKVNGHDFEVISIDPDTNEVTVRDGDKYGIQKLPSGSEITPDKGSLKRAAEVDFFGEEAPEPAKGGEMFGAEEMPFNLAGTEMKDPAELLKEKLAADERRRTLEANQGTIPGTEGYSEAAPGAGAGGDLGTPRSRTHPADDRDLSVFPIELPELVQFAKSISGGSYPKIAEQIRALHGRALGVFVHTDGPKGTARIELRADIFNLITAQEKDAMRQEAIEYAKTMKDIDPSIDEKQVAQDKYEDLLAAAFEKALKENPKLASKVLAHEIAHWVDWLPDKMISGRGNLFGRIASLKKYTKSILPEKPGAPGALTDKDRARLHREAKKLAQNELDAAGGAGENPGVTPEEILEIWQSTSARDKDPGLYDYVAKLTADQKKILVKAAMRGKIADWFVFNRDKLPNLTKSEQEYYAELLKEEIRKRRLFDLEVMQEELRQIISWWRGTDKMEPYFEKSSEMYAEALSILLNNPIAVEKRAPKFWEAFFNYLGQKPEVKKIYEAIQDDIKSGRIYRDRVINLRESWQRADTEGLKQDELSASIPFQEKIDAVRLTFDRTFGPIYRRIKQSPEIDASKTEKAIEDYLYRSTSHEAFLRKLNIEVLKPIFENNLTWVDLGEYMFHQHVIHNRADIASSLGFNAKASTERLAEMRGQFGEKRFAALEQAQKNFRKIYYDFVIIPLSKANIISKDLLDQIAEKSFYATMASAPTRGGIDPNSIEGLIRNRYGNQVTSKIYKQVGYLGEIKNPATATAQKALSLISMIHENQAKKGIIDFLVNSNDPMIKEAEMKYNGFRNAPVEIFSNRIGTITFLEGGKVQSYYVPRAISEAFEKLSPIESFLINSAMKVLNPVKGIYTELNYGFWPVAVFRDLKSFYRKMPGTSLVFGKGAFLKNFLRARTASISTFKGIHDDLADEVLRRQMVISRAESKGFNKSDDASERMFLEFGITPSSWADENLNASKKILKLWQWYKHQGQILERTTKVMGMMHLDELFGAEPPRPDIPWVSMPEVMKQRLIHEAAGSPNFLQKGRLAPIVDFFALFYGPWKEGWRSEKRAWGRNPLVMAELFAATVALPSTVLWMLENRKLDEFIQPEDAKELSEMIQSIPEYDKINYHCIPLFWANKSEKKVFYIRLPLEEGERIQNAILRNTLNKDAQIQASISYLGGSVPGLNPLLDTAKNWWDFKVNGKNPIGYTGSPIIPADAFQAGEGTSQLARYSANQMGGGILTKFGTENMYEMPKGKLEEFLKMPFVSNLLGRWVNISNRGYTDRMREVSAEVIKEHAQLRLIGQEMIKKLQAGDKFTESERQLLLNKPYLSSYLTDKIPDVIKKTSSLEMKVLLGAQSTEEKMRLLQEMSKQ